MWFRLRISHGNKLETWWDWACWEYQFIMKLCDHIFHLFCSSEKAFALLRTPFTLCFGLRLTIAIYFLSDSAMQSHGLAKIAKILRKFKWEINLNHFFSHASLEKNLIANLQSCSKINKIMIKLIWSKFLLSCGEKINKFQKLATLGIKSI